jgi:hypothetical protein
MKHLKREGETARFKKKKSVRPELAGRGCGSNDRAPV